MAQGEATDLAGLALVERALAELSRGAWRPDIAEFAAALAAATAPPVKARLANLITHHHFRSGAMESALETCRTWLEHAPDDVTARDSEVSILLRLKRYSEVIAAAGARLASEPDNFQLRGALSNACSRQGDRKAARGHGSACLAIKDSLVAAVEAEVQVAVPRFDPQARSRNVIAFSLYGADRKYTDGAIRNAVVARFLYPEWTCRFFIDASVPPEVTLRLAAEGAQLRTVEGLPAARYGTFWRFLIGDDPEVDRYLVRDCDACVSLRERAAVEDWIASGRPFHLMRDGFTHTELVLAGMWGAVRGALPPMGPAIIDYCGTAPFARTVDQAFLRERAWPHMRGRVLIHDSCFTWGGALGFPKRANVPGPKVGEAVMAPKPT